MIMFEEILYFVYSSRLLWTELTHIALVRSIWQLPIIHYSLLICAKWLSDQILIQWWLSPYMTSNEEKIVKLLSDCLHRRQTRNHCGHAASQIRGGGSTMDQIMASWPHVMLCNIDKKVLNNTSQSKIDILNLSPGVNKLTVGWPMCYSSYIHFRGSRNGVAKRASRIFQITLASHIMNR